MKRLIALVLAMSMIFGQMPVFAFAEGEDEPAPQVVEEVIPDPPPEETPTEPEPPAETEAPMETSEPTAPVVPETPAEQEPSAPVEPTPSESQNTVMPETEEVETSDTLKPTNYNKGDFDGWTGEELLQEYYRILDQYDYDTDIEFWLALSYEQQVSLMNAIMAATDSSSGTPTGEELLRSTIASYNPEEAGSGNSYTIQEPIALTGDLEIPENFYLIIAGNGSLTVPAEYALTVNGSLVFWGGSVTVNGTYAISDASHVEYNAVAYPDDLFGASCTNIPKSLIRCIAEVNSAEKFVQAITGIKTFADGGIDVTGDVTLSGKVDASGIHVVLWDNVTLKINEGAELTCANMGIGENSTLDVQGKLYVPNLYFNGQNCTVNGQDNIINPDGMTEEQLRAALTAFANAPADNQNWLELNNRITLTENLEIPQDFWLSIPRGAALTVPEGCTLYNNGVIQLVGGKLTVNGQYKAYNDECRITRYADAYFSDSDASSATNLPNSKIRLAIPVGSAEDFGAAVHTIDGNYAAGEIQVVGSFAVPVSMDLENVDILIRNGFTLTVPQGIAVSCGTLGLGNNSTLILEGTLKAKDFYRGENSMIKGRGDLDLPRPISEAQLRKKLNDIAEDPSIEERWVAIDCPVPVGQDLIIPEGVELHIWHGGELIVFDGVTLTNSGSIQLWGGNLTVNGNYAVGSDGARLEYHPSEYTADPSVCQCTNISADYIRCYIDANNTNAFAQAANIIGSNYGSGEIHIVDSFEVNTPLDNRSIGIYIRDGATLTIPAGTTLICEGLGMEDGTSLDVRGTLDVYYFNHGENCTVNGEENIHSPFDNPYEGMNGEELLAIYKDLLEYGDENQMIEFWLCLTYEQNLALTEAILADTDSSSGTPKAEELLRSTLASFAEDTDGTEHWVDITEKITLTDDLVIPNNVSIAIKEGGSLIVPEGYTLYNNGYIRLWGGYLTLSNSDQYQPCDYDVRVDYMADRYSGNAVDCLATNLSKDIIRYCILVEDYEGFQQAVSAIKSGYGSGEIAVDGNITLFNDTNIEFIDVKLYNSTSFTIPEGKTLVMGWGGTLTVGDSAILTNEGSIQLKGGSLFVDGGTYINANTTPSVTYFGNYNGGYDGETVAGCTNLGRAELHCEASVYSDDDLPGAIDTICANFASGKLTAYECILPHGGTFTLPSNIQLNIQSGQLYIPSELVMYVEGILLVQPNAAVYVDGDFSVVNGGIYVNPADCANATPAELLEQYRQLKARGNQEALGLFWGALTPKQIEAFMGTTDSTSGPVSPEDFLRQNMVISDFFDLNEKITLTKDLKIPAGKVLRINNGGQLIVPAGRTLTVDGQILLVGGQLTVNGTYKTTAYRSPICFYPVCYESDNLSEATNLLADKISCFYSLESFDNSDEVFSHPDYNVVHVTVSSDITLDHPLAVPKNYDLDVISGTLTLDAGSEMYVMGTLNLSNIGTEFGNCVTEPGSRLVIDGGLFVQEGSTLTIANNTLSVRGNAHIDGTLSGETLVCNRYVYDVLAGKSVPLVVTYAIPQMTAGRLAFSVIDGAQYATVNSSTGVVTTNAVSGKGTATILVTELATGKTLNIVVNVHPTTPERGEVALRAYLDSTTNYDPYVIEDAIVLTSNLTIPNGKTLVLNKGGFLISSAGFTLTNNGSIALSGGTLQVDGTYKSTSLTPSIVFHDHYISADPRNATNVSKNYITGILPVFSESHLQTICGNYINQFASITAILDTDLYLTDNLTIPASVSVNTNGHNLTIAADGVLTIEKGGVLEVTGESQLYNNGTIINNGSIVYQGFIDGNVSGSRNPSSFPEAFTEADLLNWLSKSDSKCIRIVAPITLTQNLTIPYNKALDIRAGGTLTVPSGKTLTNLGMIDLYGGKLTVSGTYALPNGSTVGGWDSTRYFADVYNDTPANATNLPASRYTAVKRVTTEQELVSAMAKYPKAFGRALFWIENDLDITQNLFVPPNTFLMLYGEHDADQDMVVNVAENATLISNGFIRIDAYSTLNILGVFENYGGLMNDGTLTGFQTEDDIIDALNNDGLVEINNTVTLRQSLLGDNTQSITINKGGKLVVPQGIALRGYNITLNGGYLNVQGAFGDCGLHVNMTNYCAVSDATNVDPSMLFCDYINVNSIAELEAAIQQYSKVRMADIALCQPAVLDKNFTVPYNVMLTLQQDFTIGKGVILTNNGVLTAAPQEETSITLTVNGILNNNSIFQQYGDVTVVNGENIYGIPMNAQDVSGICTEAQLEAALNSSEAELPITVMGNILLTKNTTLNVPVVLAGGARLTVMEGVNLYVRDTLSVGTGGELIVNGKLFNTGKVQGDPDAVIYSDDNWFGYPLNGQSDAPLTIAITEDDLIKQIAQVAASGDQGFVGIYSDITLTKNLTIPQNVTVEINEGATLTVPSGKTLKVVGALNLIGGYLNMKGTYAVGDANYPHTYFFAFRYNGNSDPSLGTNLDAKKVNLVVEPADGDEFVNAADNASKYGRVSININNDITVDRYCEIAPNVSMWISSKLSIASGVTIRSYSSDITLSKNDSNTGVINVESGAQLVNYGYIGMRGGYVCTANDGGLINSGRLEVYQGPDSPKYFQDLREISSLITGEVRENTMVWVTAESFDDFQAFCDSALGYQQVVCLVNGDFEIPVDVTIPQSFNVLGGPSVYVDMGNPYRPVTITLADGVTLHNQANIFTCATTTIDASCGYLVNEPFTAGDGTQEYFGYIQPGCTIKGLGYYINHYNSQNESDDLDKLVSGKSMDLKAFNQDGIYDAGSKITFALSQEDSQYASITAAGRLTAKAVTAPHTIQVLAYSTNYAPNFLKDPQNWGSNSYAVTIYPAASSVLISDGEKNVTGSTITVDLGANPDSEFFFAPSLLPMGAMEDNIRWTVSDTTGKYGTYETDGNTLHVSGLHLPTASPATVTLTAKDAASGKSAVVKLNLICSASSIAIQDNSGWMTDNEGNILLRGGATQAFKAQLDDNPSITDKTILWEVTLEGDNVPANASPFATISTSGSLATKAVAEPVLLTVTAYAKANPIARDSVKVKLLPAATSAYIEGTVPNVPIIVDRAAGVDSITLFGGTLPETANQQGTWKSSSTTIATVNEYGTVTFKKDGTVTITFTAKDGSGKSASVKVSGCTPVKNIDITTTAVDGFNVKAGKSITLKATATTKVDGLNPTNNKVTWTTSDPTVATVSSSGVVTAKTVYDISHVTITATAADGSGVSKDVEITVLPTVVTIKWNTETELDRIVKNNDTIPVRPGQTINLEGYVNGNSADFNWTSSAPAVATVDKLGHVSALKNGTAVLTVKDPSTGMVGKVTVKVSVPVEDLNPITVTKRTNTTDDTILTSGKSTLTLTTSPTNPDASVKTVTWTSDNPNVLVSTSGVVSTKANITDVIENVTITATAKDGSGENAFYCVTVIPATTALNVLTAEESSIITTDRDSSNNSILIPKTTVLNGRTIKLDIDKTPMNEDGVHFLDFASTTYPEDAADQVTWTSSSKKIADFADPSSGRLTIYGTGTVTVTAKATDGSGKSNSFKLNIVRYAKSVSIANTIVGSGCKITLVPTFDVDAAMLTSKAVTYSLRPEDAAYATVSASGVVTAKTVTAQQDVVVTVTCKDDPTITGSCTVSIMPKITKVTINAPQKDGCLIEQVGTARNWKMDIEDVQEIDLSTLTQPYQGSVTWTSSNKAIAEFEGSTLILKKAGTITVTATATDGSNAKDSIKLTLVCNPKQIALNRTNYNLAGGCKVTLDYTMLPNNPEKFTLSSKAVFFDLYPEDKAYASISASGVVTAKTITEPTDITAWIYSKDNLTVCESVTIHLLPKSTAVTVYSRFDPTDEADNIVTSYGFYENSVLSNGKVWKVDLETTPTLSLKATVSPANACQEVIWTSSNVKLARFDNPNEGIVTLLGTGSVTLTAKTTDGTNKSITVKLNIVRNIKNIQFLLPDGTVDVYDEPLYVAAGCSAPIKYALETKQGVAPTSKAVKFALQGDGAAYGSVSTSGSVSAKATAVGQNFYVLMWATDNPSVAVLKEVIVVPKAASMVINDAASLKTQSFTAEDTIDLDVTLRYSDGSEEGSRNNQVTWTSSNTKIATIDSNGIVTYNTANNLAGTVTFTAKAVDGSGKSASVALKFVKQ